MIGPDGYAVVGVVGRAMRQDFADLDRYASRANRLMRNA